LFGKSQSCIIKKNELKVKELKRCFKQERGVKEVGVLVDL